MKKNVVPVFISAEGLLKLRSGGSILDHIEVPIAARNKREPADPVLIKKAVLELKRNGYSVSHVGKYTISFSGMRSSFEDTFQVVFSSEEGKLRIKEKDDSSFIDTTETPFSEMLNGIIINQSPQLLCQGQQEPPAKENTLEVWAHEIPLKLGLSDLSWESQRQFFEGLKPKKKIKVVIIDSGFYRHSYLANKQYFPGGIPKITIDSRVKETIDKIFSLNNKKKILESQEQSLTQLARCLNNSSIRLNDPSQERNYFEISGFEDDELIDVQGCNIFESDFVSGKEIKEKYLELKESVLEIISDKEGFRNSTNIEDAIGQINTEIAEQPIEQTIKTLLELSEPDSDGHGTQMFANFLSIAGIALKHLDIHLIKNTGLPTVPAIDLALALKPDIISCSFGTPDDPRHSALKTLIRDKLNDVHSDNNEQPIIVCGTGNKDGELEKYKSIEAQSPYVVSVGGAYRKEDRIHASEIAHGGWYDYSGQKDRLIPDICGLCGPLSGYFQLPTIAKENCWQYTPGGTSSATAQIAAVCALIKVVYPKVSLDDIRTILRYKSDKIQEGKFYFQDEKLEVEIKDLVGLVNIKKAIEHTLDIESSRIMELTRIIN